ncbi:MAG: translocation/assembly module TamB domain-containing protein [Gemmatimonadaceae bacterium]
MRRATRISLAALVAFLVLPVLAVLVLTHSDFGRARVRAVVLRTLQDRIRGRVEIGRIEGNVLGGFSLDRVRISDSSGAPFLVADRISASLSTRSLLSRRISISGITLERPVVRLIKVPDEPWNYAQIFHREPGTAPDTSLGFGDWITLSHVDIRDGVITIERPWLAGETTPHEAWDSTAAVALAGDTRTRVDRAPYGLRQTMEFRSLNAELSRVIIADPFRQDVVLSIDSLSMVAAPFRPPEFDVRRFSGEVRVGPDTVTSSKFKLRLPGTRASGSFTYLLESGDLFTAIHADTLSFADVRGAYLSLPDSGGGRLDARAVVRDSATSEYLVTNADLHLGATRLQGQLRLSLADSASAFSDTDVRFTRLPTSLITRFAPNVELPLSGELTGRARLDGALRAMQVDADAMFDPERQPPFRIVARGGIGSGSGFTAQGLYVRGGGVPASILREFGADTPIDGVFNVQATLTGSSATTLRGPYQLSHHERGIVSRIQGNGSIAVGDSLRMDVGVRLVPVSLELVEAFVKGTDFRGDVTGSGRLWGTPRSLATRLDLQLPDSGTLRIDGLLRRPSDNVPAYSGTFTMQRIDVQSIVPAMPTTTIDGVAKVEGRDFALATMNTRLSANLRILMVDSAEFRNVVMNLAARDGQLTVDTLHAVSSFGSASLGGTMGLVDGRTGALRYRAQVTDLGGLARWISTGDTNLVAARPGVAARLARIRDRADSIRLAREQPVDPAAQLAADMRSNEPPRQRGAAPKVAPIPRDSIAGNIVATGEMRGSVRRFDLDAVARSSGIIWGGSLIGAGSVTAHWTDGGTSDNAVTAEGGVDTLRVAGFALDSTRFRGRYKSGEGDLELAVYPGDTAEYRLGAVYALRTGEGEVRLRDVRLRFDSTAWASTRASVIRWRGRGITIDSLELRNRGGRGEGRIFVNGELPDVDPGRLELAIDSLRLAPWLTLLQSDLNADGVATFSGVLEGTRCTPRIGSQLSIVGARYRGIAFPDVRARLDYDQRQLRVDGSMHRGMNGALARITGTVPIDLTIDDSVTSRMIDAPLALTIVGDSMPLSPIPDLVDELTVLDGRAFGRIVIGGTWTRPRLEGDIGVNVARAGLASTGVVMTDIVGRLHMSGDTLVIDSLAGRSKGAFRGRGAIVLAELDRPVLDVTLESTSARVLDDHRGELFADASVQVRGPIDTLAVSGRASITHGVVYIPDPDRMDVINTEDPAIFAVIDTATARSLDVAPPSEVMRNLRLDLDLEVQRGTFGRSPDANVEVYGNLALRMDPSTRGKVAVTGALYSDQGDYTFLGKRFAVTRGSVRFTGEPDPNPILQILATYEVRQAGRAPLDIRVILGGTLQRPNVSLESDAQPTLSQSDLIAFLAFGQSSSSLLQFSGTGLEGGGAGGSSLAGNVAALATRQLASIALGALVDEAKADLARSTRADVLNITPAELPADISLGAFQTVLRGTEIEIGKYVSRHTFVLGRVRPSAAIPGVSMERRLNDKLRVRVTFESRYQPRRPSLSAGLEPKAIHVMGTLLSWRLAW